MGVEVIEMEDSVRVRGTCRPKKVNLKTLPYPGFPTDLQQPMTALLSTGEGMSIITEGIFEFRYRHVDELRRMGANIKVEDREAIIQGVEKLTGASLKATDLRAGVALVIAGLMAEGQTEIEDLHHIDRGYENLEEKLAALGADIKRVGKGETILKKVDKDAAI
jgi:UDP-N-acetylglucosamine 1-carboxyvinyltransferase